MKAHLLAIVTVLATGCTRVYFEQPQPQESKALSSFPDHLRGAYIADKDTFYIKDDEFTYTEFFDKIIPLADTNSSPSITIKDSLIYDKSSLMTEGAEYSIINDSLHYRIKLKISQVLSDSLVLKTYDHFLVLNEREDKQEYWNTFLIERFENGDISVWSVGNFKTETNHDNKIKYEADLKKFYKITAFRKINDDEYLINPSLKEFKKLLKNGFFTKADTFKLIHER